MDNKQEQIARIIAVDKRLRKQIADLYYMIKESDNPSEFIPLLAEHVNIMVEMIEDVRKPR
ncbi:MAG: hypothetical protein MUD12_08255 [Spirochaetes bacterium]|jgi:hypothetical protein|nr:hypothetical protein [Spirochaetota bacterium]